MSVVQFHQVADEASLVRYHSIVRASFAADFEALPADPIEDLLPALSGRLADLLTELWLGLVNGEEVLGYMLRRSDRDNVDVGILQVTVHPDHRSNGYGSAAIDAAIERCHALGLRRLIGEVPAWTVTADQAPGRGLMAKYGASPLLTDQRRLLDLTALDSERLQQKIDELQARAAGYSTLVWRDRAPEELVDDLAQLHALMSTDPPQGDLAMEPEVWDAARYLEHEQSVLDRGRKRLFCGVRHDASGELVGFTDLGVPAGDVPIGYQWSTIVRDDHRGHRLGMLVKLVNLQHVRAELPSVTHLNTWNAESNTFMIAVNHELGYVDQEKWSEFGLDLAATNPAG